MSDVKKDIARAEQDVWETALKNEKDKPIVMRELYTLLASAGAGALIGGLGGGALRRALRRGKGQPISLTGGALGGIGGGLATGAGLPNRQFETKRQKKARK